MSDYTPTTKVVRGDYIAHSATYAGKPSSESRAEFDRWLAKHDREVAAAALREAASDPEIQDNRPWVEWRLRNRIQTLEEQPCSCRGEYVTALDIVDGCTCGRLKPFDRMTDDECNAAAVQGDSPTLREESVYGWGPEES